MEIKHKYKEGDIFFSYDWGKDKIVEHKVKLTYCYGNKAFYDFELANEWPTSVPADDLEKRFQKSPLESIDKTLQELEQRKKQLEQLKQQYEHGDKE